MAWVRSPVSHSESSQSCASVSWGMQKRAGLRVFHCPVMQKGAVSWLSVSEEAPCSLSPLDWSRFGSWDSWLLGGICLFVSLPCCFYDKITHTAVLKPSLCAGTHSRFHTCTHFVTAVWGRSATDGKQRSKQKKTDINPVYITIISFWVRGKRDEETVKRARRSLFSQEACSGNQQTFLRTCISTGLRIELLRNQI